jgi:hypothetical protein
MTTYRGGANQFLGFGEERGINVKPKYRRLRTGIRMFFIRFGGKHLLVKFIVYFSFCMFHFMHVLAGNASYRLWSGGGGGYGTSATLYTQKNKK